MGERSGGNQKILQKSLAATLERVFGLAKAGSDLRTEFLAGLTTFLTMVYIVFVNPQISAIPEWTKAQCLSRPALPQRYPRWLWRYMPIIRSRLRRAWGLTRSSPSRSF